MNGIHAGRDIRWSGHAARRHSSAAYASQAEPDFAGLACLKRVKAHMVGGIKEHH